MDKDTSVLKLAEELMRLFPTLGRQIAMHMRELGEEETTLMQISVLHQIKERPLITSELAKRRKVSLQSASVLVRALADKGWLTRIPNPDDARQLLLQITPEGMKKTEATRNVIINYLATFLSEMNAEEIAAAQIFLPALSRILTQHTADENTEEES